MFEGSCALIPVKVVANYCKKLADEFIPELVETLASEMNPDTVCTVAGKCFLHWHRHRSLPIPEIVQCGYKFL